jgi:hypothetical protein
LAIVRWMRIAESFGWLAVLPVENATGETQLDWASTGFMALR